MTKLNLITKNKQEEMILTYLQNNASEMLINKINNGTPSEKDGIPLINKKTLSGFMKYACNEAKKLAQNGENSICIEDSTVFGWAIHYFEENEIIETLYKQDGTIYANKTIKQITNNEKTKQKPNQNKIKVETKQITLFDFINQDNTTEKPNEKINKETNKSINEENINIETGEIISNAQNDEISDNFDKKLLLDIGLLLDDKIIIE